MTTLDTEHLMAWKGRRETLEDDVTAAPCRLMRATLDLPPDAAMRELPSLWHWLYFLPSPRQSELGPDGHARRGGFMPPVPLPRRMWAGSQLEFLQPLRIGDAIRRESTIEDVAVKTGRTGTLCFVRVRHEVSNAHGLAIREFHDIVYREPPAPGAAPAYDDAPAAEVAQRVTPDDVLLFRYSALTFNGHRIHYDRRYVTEVEGYPGLVVHGPLLATLMAGLGERQFAGRTAASFTFRALKPVFDLHPFDVCGRRDGDDAIELWVRDHAGHRAMSARMAFRP
jgi:3-methylfumaryl-CoA hydratase